ncbi:MAG: hypothetical protein ACREA9_12020 [Pyrinomonadaceae bacterium]
MTSAPSRRNLAFERQSAGSWADRPFQLVNLREMLEFSALKYVKMVVALERLTSIFNVNVQIHEPLLTGQGKERLTDPIQEFIENAEKMGLSASAAFAREIVAKIEASVGILDSVTLRARDQRDGALYPQDVNAEISSLRRVFYNELKTYDFLTVLPLKQDYYNKPLELFWGDNARYDSVAVDIENAGKCFALNRNTACVFHLMRALETSLRLFVTSLGHALPKHNRSWGVILQDPIKNLRETDPTKRSPQWNSNRDFYAGATARLLAVKDAWRNTTMHVEINYDEEQAKEVWDHVKSFMRHVATTIPE